MSGEILHCCPIVSLKNELDETLALVVWVINQNIKSYSSACLVLQSTVLELASEKLFMLRKIVLRSCNSYRCKTSVCTPKLH